MSLFGAGMILCLSVASFLRHRMMENRTAADEIPPTPRESETAVSVEKTPPLEWNDFEMIYDPASEDTSFTVQVTSTPDRSAALETARNLADKGHSDVYIQTVAAEPHETQYKICVGRFSSEADAWRDAHRDDEDLREGFVRPLRGRRKSAPEATMKGAS